MSTLLTIDFDIIMSPSIEIYNNLIGEEFNGIEDLFKAYPFAFCNFNADFKIYQKLTDIIRVVTKKIPKKNIFFEKHHDDIYLKHKDIYPIDTIINIDHHHDLGYGGDKAEQIEMSNWARYLFNHDLIKNYIWVDDLHSDLAGIELVTEKKLIYDFYVNPYLKDIEYLALCESAYWVPDRYNPLFRTWIDLFA